MTTLAYRMLDIGFTVFHTSLTVFNLVGWVWKRTRRVHLVTIGLTVLSWFGLGFFYGFGYCPSTDWHWQVKMKLGEYNLPTSYVKYYCDRLTGVSWDPALVDGMVLVAGITALVLSMTLNYKDWRRGRRLN